MVEATTLGKQKPQSVEEYTDGNGRIDSIKINRSLMSRVLRIDLAHISRIFSGQRTPSMEVAKKIADYMSITLDKLDGELAAIREKRKVEKRAARTSKESK